MPEEQAPSVQTMVARPLRGMDQRWTPPPQNAARVRDMRWDPRDGWRSAGGFRELVADYDNGEETVNSYDNEERITSLHWYAQYDGGVQWLIYTTASGRWAYFNGSGAPETNSMDIYFVDGTRFDGTAKAIDVVDGVSWGPQYQSWGNLLYMVNGVNEAYVFDGWKADRAGFLHGPKAPDVYAANKDSASSNWQTTSDTRGLGGLAAAGSTLTVGYKYKCSFMNERGQESPPSEASRLVTWDNTATSRGVVTVDLPVGDSSVTGRRLYRTQNLLDENGEPLVTSNAENYFYHSTIEDNITTLMQDHLPDAALGNVVDELDFGPWPLNATLLAEFKGTMFVATATYSGVYFSAPGMPEVFPVDNRFPMTSDASGPPTALHATKNALVVYKERGIWLVKGDPSTGFYAEPLNTSDGASGPGCVKELNGLGVVSVGTSGVKLLQGALENTGTPTQLVDLGQQIQDEIDDWNISALANARGAVYHRDREMWFVVPRLGEVYPTRVLVYHWEIGAWSYRENYPIGAIVETGDHRGYLIFGSHDTTNVPGLHVYSPGWEDKGGVWNIDPMYETAHVSFGNLWRGVIPHRIGVYCIGYGEDDIRATYTVNRGMAVDFDANVSESGDAYLSHDQMYPLDDEARDPADSTVYLVPRYSGVVWGDDGATTANTWKWAEHRPVVLWWNFSTMHKGPLHELQLQFTPEGRHMQVLGWELEFKGVERRILPLSDNYGGGTV